MIPLQESFNVEMEEMTADTLAHYSVFNTAFSQLLGNDKALEERIAALESIIESIGNGKFLIYGEETQDIQ